MACAANWHEGQVVFMWLVRHGVGLRPGASIGVGEENGSDCSPYVLKSLCTCSIVQYGDTAAGCCRDDNCKSEVLEALLTHIPLLKHRPCPLLVMIH